MQFVKTNNEPFVIAFDIPTAEKVSKIFSIGVDTNHSIDPNIFVILAGDAQNAELYNNCINSADQTCKTELNNILISLKTAKRLHKDYSLIILESDAITVRDIDNQMIETFKSFDSPIVFGGSEFPLTFDDFTNSKVYSVEGPCKYLNPSCIFGEVDALVSFFEEFNRFYKDNYQVLDKDIPIKLICLEAAFSIFVSNYENLDFDRSIDSHSKLFATVNVNEHRLEERDNKRYILAEGMYFIDGGIL